MTARPLKRSAGLALVLSMAGTLAACGGSSGSSGKVKIEFFQSKSESIAVVNKLIKEFEQSHPDITVVQNNAPDALTALKTGLVKGNVPDVIAVNVSVYNDVAKTNVLAPQTGTAAAKAVNATAAIDYTNKAGQTGGKTYALPWTVNAQVVLYDKDEFAKLGLRVPTTWAEFVQTAQKIKAAGQQPFEFTWKDNWTAKLLLNSLAGPTQGSDFWQKLQGGSATFSGSAAYRTATDRLLQLKKFAQSDPFGTTYDDGNAAFANGKSAMYVQGTWAIPEITAINAHKNIGEFVLPTGDTASQNLLLSGPDSVVGVAKSGSHEKQAQEFVDFLFSKSAQQEYADDQHLISVRNDVAPSDSGLAQLKKEWIDTDKTAMYPDGMFTGASNLAGLTQTFLYDGNAKKYLGDVDSDFGKNGIK
ncbi:ABC transporter substrate-binding protein [Streptomyces shenzhenensis]|uniref:ABC transporter substrate-binding protein n=1 Tax=Streptomyces shenzhenensis TaxID=943815 RepID=UPI003801E635